MKYKNRKTGSVIDVESKISGENWELMDEEDGAEEPTNEKSEKKATGKKEVGVK